MCTVTWRRDTAGFSLLMNRDELTGRGAATPPRELDIGGVPVLAPVDPDAGGTWISVNAAGVALCLLNRYPESESGWHPPAGFSPPAAQSARPSPVRSRGLLVLQHAAAPSGEEVLKSLAQADLRSYAPFTLLVIDPDSESTACRWDGFRLRCDAAGPPLSSSSFDGEAVVASRFRTYGEMVGSQPTVDELRAYHRSHQPERGPYSVCAHRDDGGSRSLTEIHVGPDEVVMRYAPGPPCRSGETQTATLARQPR